MRCMHCSGIHFLSQHAEGEGEFTILVLLTLTAGDYINLGRILTHRFLQFGAFPVRINQVSIQQAIFGHVPDECILSSFFIVSTFLGERESIQCSAR